jgi:3-oxoacid CoA-transferase A subunit/3-oxoacid CoA-transferase B subunit
MPEKLDELTMARRVAAELYAGQVVALGSGLPCRVAEVMPGNAPVQFLSESGALGYVAQAAGAGPEKGGLTGFHLTGYGLTDYGLAGSNVDSAGGQVALAAGGSVVSLVDLAGMLRGGHVDVAVIQPYRVSAAGDFISWTTAATPGIFAPGAAVDLAAGAKRVIAMLSHTGSDPNETPNLVADISASPLADGRNCVNLIVTDLAVIQVTEQGLELVEVAPGWRADAVAALTGAPLRVAENVREIASDLPAFGPIADKVYPDGPTAIRDLPEGATVMIDGFGGPGGMAHYLLMSLREMGTGKLTIISNTAGIARSVNFGTPPGRLAIDHSVLIDNGQVAKAIATYPVSPSASRPSSFELAYRRGEVELELVPQGTLAERLRAGGAGIAAFYTPTGVGTLIAEGKETRTIDGKEYVLEEALRADFCLIRGYKADTLGNVVYKGTSRNFNAVMAPAARITVVEVDEIVEPGQLDPELIVTPGIYVDRLVKRPEGFSPYE